MQALKAQLAELSQEVSSKSALGKAVSYTLNHWTGLTAFLDDGRTEVDSNIVERSMKSVALTRKNSLFAGNARGGKTFAILASLINTCKLNGMDPQTWPFGACNMRLSAKSIADVLDRIITGKVTAKQMATLFPWVWRLTGTGR